MVPWSPLLLWLFCFTYLNHPLPQSHSRTVFSLFSPPCHMNGIVILYMRKEKHFVLLIPLWRDRKASMPHYQVRGSPWQFQTFSSSKTWNYRIINTEFLLMMMSTSYYILPTIPTVTILLLQGDIQPTNYFLPVHALFFPKFPLSS